MDMQIIVVGVLVVGCVIALVRGAMRQVKSTAGGCSGCGGCAAAKNCKK